MALHDLQICDSVQQEDKGLAIRLSRPPSIQPPPPNLFQTAPPADFSVRPHPLQELRMHGGGYNSPVANVLPLIVFMLTSGETGKKAPEVICFS